MSLRLVALISVLSQLTNAVNPRLTQSGREATYLAERAPSNVCKEIGVGTFSTPGVDYFNGAPDGCPFKNRLEADGSCMNGIQLEPKRGCAAYCEIKNTYFYGEEVPIDVPLCQDDQECDFTKEHTQTTTQQFAFNIGISLAKRNVSTDALHYDSLDNLSWYEKRDDEVTKKWLQATYNLGASYTLTKTTTDTVAASGKKPARWPSGTCGYWTSVPAFITSCGSLTTFPLKPDENKFSSGGNSVGAPAGNLPVCDLTKKKTTSNWCQTTPVLNSSGLQVSQTIFVAYDCHTFQLLPISQQDQIYQFPGVSVATHIRPG